MRQKWHSIREYEALRAMVLAKTTTAAAMQLGISQSAVSRAIANLEARTGKTLFYREGGRLQPTSEALRLNKVLDPIFDSLADIDGEKLGELSGEELRIAAPPTIAHRLLQNRISSFLKTHEKYSLVLDICASDALVNGVAEERFDLGVSDVNTNHLGVRVSPFRKSKVVCAVPETSPLRHKLSVGPADLDGQDMVALTKRHSLRVVTDQHISAAGVRPNIVVETATSVSALEFVRAGIGLALINPFPIVASSEDGVVIKPFEPVEEFRTSFLLPAGRALSNAARGFMRHIRQTIPEDPWSEAIK